MSSARRSSDVRPSLLVARRSRLFHALLVLAICSSSFAFPAIAAEVIPHGQDKMPGAALSPAEAMKKMTLPDGFAVELVAAEPDIVNPTAMTIDECGRFWITESIEYPRHDAGPGKDRIKVLESTKGDGHIDKITVFADGLNIPSGIAVGHGGVWVCNSPDILFMQDTHGTGHADKREVVVTGFGRYDTHELPNSLTWGPDGYLYGLNGVFNEAVIKQRGKEFRFTCAMFRINPRTREFEVFCEGTSNPWGIAWDPHGSAFVSACVVDHLWHLVETGYYQRQGGPYPPFTWILPSIVHERHQKAAYCGLLYMDTDAFPEKYRDKLLMGNIHGGCLNVDSLRRNGSTYTASNEPDFLTANDAWFMPVSQKIGPDGCLYVLDWYDQYHCYQDAQRDPAGIDRRNGRLYRISYKGTPHSGKIDLGKETDAQLVERLKSPNIYFRETAQRLLAERKSPEARPLLEKLVLDDKAAHKARMHALWSLIAMGPLDKVFHRRILANDDEDLRAWGVRASGMMKPLDPLDPVLLNAMCPTADPSPDVQLQKAIAARKMPIDPVVLLLRVLAAAEKDPLIPAIVWQNLSPLIDDRADAIFKQIAKDEDLRRAPAMAEFMPRLIDRTLARPGGDVGPIVAYLGKVSGGDDRDVIASQKCLALLAQKVQNRELIGARLDEIKLQLEPILKPIIAAPDSPLFLDAAFLGASWKDPVAIEAIRKTLTAIDQPHERRLQALAALLAARDHPVLDAVAAIFAERKQNSAALRAAILGALGRADDSRVSEIVLNVYRDLEPELQPKAIELLTQRPEWAKPLLEAIGRQEVSANALNVNQVQKLLASRDKELVALVTTKWGAVRTQRNPQREQVVADVRKLLQQRHGDAKRGEAVFKKVCAQCHRIYGEGQDVGPDITVNGRGSFDQLLSNVLDPSLVVGAGYQARLVTTTDGRTLTGLLVEDSPQRVVLKEQGGKLDTIPRAEVDSVTVSKLSLMPEGLEKQLTEKELIDVFEFLLWDKHPSDPAAKRLPGAPRR
jgi:putative heme-binding domain-containing protein